MAGWERRWKGTDRQTRMKATRYTGQELNGRRNGNRAGKQGATLLQQEGTRMGCTHEDNVARGRAGPGSPLIFTARNVCEAGS